MACSDMKIEEIEREYGPVEILRKLTDSIEDPAIFSQHLLKKKKNEENDKISVQSKEISKNQKKYVAPDIQNVMLDSSHKSNGIENTDNLDSNGENPSEKDMQNQAWLRLKDIGITEQEINKIQRKMVKLHQRLPIAKL